MPRGVKALQAAAFLCVCLPTSLALWPAAVEFAEPDYLVRVDWEPNDSLMRAEWHHSAISSRVAWNVSRGSSLVKVRQAAGPGGHMQAGCWHPGNLPATERPGIHAH